MGTSGGRLWPPDPIRYRLEEGASSRSPERAYRLGVDSEQRVSHDTKVPEANPVIADAARLPRPVILLGWVSFFADVSSEMIYPLMPLFIVGVLGATTTVLGGIEGAAAAVVAFLGAWAGFRSDRRRKRVPYVRWGYGLPVLGKAMIAIAFAWPMVLAGRLVDRVGKGLRGSPRDALIADATDESIRGRAFGFHRAMDTAGAMVGVLLSAGLVWWFIGTPRAPAKDALENLPPMQSAGDGFRLVFGISAVLALISLAITFLVRESEPQTTSTRPQATGRADGRVLSSSYWRTVSLLVIFTLGNSSDAFLLLRASEVSLTPWAVVLAYALYNVTYALLSYPAGIVSDRLGRWRVMALGWAIYAVAYLGFAYTNAVGIWFILPLYGVYMALTDGVSKALVVDHARRERRGTALGVYYMLIGLASVVANLFVGLVWHHYGATPALCLGAGCAGLALILIPVLRPHLARAE